MPIDETMFEHAFWSQRPDPEIPSYNLITFRVYGPPQPEHRYEGRAAVERLARYVEGFSAGRSSGRRGEPINNDQFTPTSQLPERMRRLSQEAAQKAGDANPDNIAFATIGRWRLGLSLNAAVGLWMFSAQLVDGGKATKADELRLSAAVEALGVPESAIQKTMGKSRYFIWKQDGAPAVDAADGAGAIADVLRQLIGQ